MQLHDVLADGQPEADAGHLRIATAGKGGEDPFRLRWRDAPSRVAHREADRLLGGLDLQPCAPACRGELHSVGEEVDEDLAEPDRVGEDARHAGDARPFDCHPGRLRKWRDHPGDLVDDRRKIDRLEAHVEPACLQAPQVEKVVDQDEEIPRHRVDAPSQSAELRLLQSPERTVGEQLGRDHDPADGPPQLVREAAEEEPGRLHLAAEGTGGSGDAIHQLGRRRIGGEHPGRAPELSGHPVHEPLVQFREGGASPFVGRIDEADLLTLAEDRGGHEGGEHGMACGKAQVGGVLAEVVQAHRPASVHREAEHAGGLALHGFDPAPVSHDEAGIDEAPHLPARFVEQEDCRHLGVGHRAHVVHQPLQDARGPELAHQRQVGAYQPLVLRSEKQALLLGALSLRPLAGQQEVTKQLGPDLDRGRQEGRCLRATRRKALQSGFQARIAGPDRAPLGAEHLQDGDLTEIL